MIQVVTDILTLRLILRLSAFQFLRQTVQQCIRSSMGCQLTPVSRNAVVQTTLLRNKYIRTGDVTTHDTTVDFSIQRIQTVEVRTGVMLSHRGHQRLERIELPLQLLQLRAVILFRQGGNLILRLQCLHARCVFLLHGSIYPALYSLLRLGQLAHRHHHNLQRHFLRESKGTPYKLLVRKLISRFDHIQQMVSLAVLHPRHRHTKLPVLVAHRRVMSARNLDGSSRQRSPMTVDCSHGAHKTLLRLSMTPYHKHQRQNYI